MKNLNIGKCVKANKRIEKSSQEKVNNKSNLVYPAIGNELKI
ncbi:MAG: hypothetical protein ACRDDY_08740 [Clostridium sp.]